MSILSFGLVVKSIFGSIDLILSQVSLPSYYPLYVNPAAANPLSENNHPETYFVLCNVIVRLNQSILYNRLVD